ncbi:MAG: short-chain fatty acyl-CoA regulator family protein [Pseudomonadota bacterium]
MTKTLIGPQLRKLRRDRGQTQAEMARRLGVSASYVNLLENNQRSLSVQVLMALTEAYGVDIRAVVGEGAAAELSDLRAAARDPLFAGEAPDLTELRAALDHAPRLAERFLQLHQSHRALMKSLRSSGEGPGVVPASPETAIHDFFRGHENHFCELEDAADAARAAIDAPPDELYSGLKRLLAARFGVEAHVAPAAKMPDDLRVFDRARGSVALSEALEPNDRSFQLAHIFGLLAHEALLDRLAATAGPAGRARCRIELANYFAAAVLMPYRPFLERAEASGYDALALASAFDVSFEQAGQRLTTLQRDGARGVPFFFLRIDEAGNVTKRFNATDFTLAEEGGSCPVWNVHTAFRAPGVVVIQFVELPEGARFFTFSRTTPRPRLGDPGQERTLVVTLGCELKHVDDVAYAAPYRPDAASFAKIGINCHVCPRQACPQRAHEPLHVKLSVDADRRGSNRYES